MVGMIKKLISVVLTLAMLISGTLILPPQALAEGVVLASVNTISGTISLPTDVYAPTEGLVGKVYLYPENSGTVTSTGFTIPSGGNSVPYTVTAPAEASDKGYRVRYYLENNYPGYVGSGYYITGGTTSDHQSATIFYESAVGVNLKIFTGNTVSGTLTLPVGKTAPTGGIKGYINISPTDSSGNYYANFTIPVGGNYASYTVTVPKNDATIGYRVSYGLNSDNAYAGFVGSGYYSLSGTTANSSDATIVDVGSTNILGKDFTINSGNTITGKISLPGSRTAPAGGITGNVSVSSQTGNYYYYANYDIPSGESSVNYTVTVPVDDDIEGYYVRNYVSDSVKYGYVEQGNYSANGITSPNYSAAIPININNGNVPNINLELMTGNKLSGTISLPSDVTAPIGGMTGYVGVYPESGGNGYNARFTIRAGGSSVSYAVIIPIDTSITGYRVSYGFYSNYPTYPGFVGTGYYSDTGTTPNYNSAKLINLNEGNLGDINLTFIKGAAISGTIFLPVGQYAPTSGIEGNISINAQNGGTHASANFKIAAGKSSAEYTATVPLSDTATGYRVSYYLYNNNSSGYLGSGYYITGGTTTDYSSASLVEVIAEPVSGINLTLLMSGNTLPSSVSLNKDTAIITAGQTEQLTAAMLPANVTDKSVTWTVQSQSYSQSGDIATVSTTGLVTAINVGTAAIRATSNADTTKYAECNVTVTDPNYKLAAGGHHTVAIKEDGTVWAWGANGVGQLGDGTTTTRLIPLQVMSGVKSVGAGNSHSLAIKEDGTLWAWGNNASGQLGDGTTTTRLNPVQVMSGVKSVAAGYGHTLAIKTDGTLWGWGWNYNGQLGDGTTTYMLLTPVQILSDVKFVAAGRDSSMAIQEDGTLWAWGANSYGQLGDGTQVRKLSPVQVLNSVKSVSTNEMHSLAITEDGTLWAWGWNSVGQLGDGTETISTTPVQVMSGVKGVAAGYKHTVAIRENGTLWAWGSNEYGQLGDGTTTNSVTPAQVMSGVKSVVAGHDHTVVIKEDGTLMAWGSNQSMQLGDGTTTNNATPVNVSLITVNTAGISLNKASTSLIVGQTDQLTSTVTPANASYKSVTWSVFSQNPTDVVTVSPTGLVTAMNVGTAVIRATSNADSTIFAECNITVNPTKIISGQVFLPQGMTASSGVIGGDIVIEPQNVGKAYYASFNIPVLGSSASFTATVPVDETIEGYLVRYSLYSNISNYVRRGYYSENGTTTLNFATLVSAKAGNASNIDLTLLLGNTISGTISLPSGEVAPDEGIYGSIYVAPPNEGDFIVSGGGGGGGVVAPLAAGAGSQEKDNGYYSQFHILPGKSSASYTTESIPVDASLTGYHVSYMVYNRKYVGEGYYSTIGTTTSNLATPVNVNTGNKSNIDLTLLTGKVISGKISLPSGVTEPDIGISGMVSIDPLSGGKPYTTYFYLPTGVNFADYSVTVPVNTLGTGYRVNYSFYDTYEGYLGSGYYSEDGTTPILSSATLVKVDSSDVPNIDLTLLTGDSAAFSATPVVKLGVNPKANDGAGMYIGLENIKDSTGALVESAKLSAYKIEVGFSPSHVSITEVIDETNSGPLFSKTIDVNSAAGKVLVERASGVSISDFDKLFFIPIALTGSAHDITGISVKFTEVVDANHHTIQIPSFNNIKFQRGKIHNGETGNPRIADAVAGMQYLAKLKNPGFTTGNVNLVNMASIIESNVSLNVVKPNVKDIIALMQYVVNLRDDHFLPMNIVPDQQTATPSITGTVRAGDTSVSGTAAAGASVVINVDGVAIAPVIATNGNWTVIGLTLVQGVVISATAQSVGETVSEATTTTVEAQEIINIPITSITVNSAGGVASVQKGSTLAMSAMVLPLDATNQVLIWSVESLAGGTATIDPVTGVLTGTGEGTVTVIATNAESGRTGTKVITVEAVPVALDLIVTSSAFADGGAIPNVNVLSGWDNNYSVPAAANQSIPLNWGSAALAGHSFFIIMTDTTAGYWNHWVVKNISNTTTSIYAGASTTCDQPGTMPAGSVELLNSWGPYDAYARGYYGPKPPQGTGTHHYVIEVFELDTTAIATADEGTGYSYDQLRAKIDSHIVRSGEITGTYTAP